MSTIPPVRVTMAAAITICVQHPGCTSANKKNKN
jgi:hypothetical protein